MGMPEHFWSPPLQGPQLLQPLLFQAVEMTYGLTMGSLTPTSPQAERLARSEVVIHLFLQQQQKTHY